jgi:hypothetical protein
MSRAERLDSMDSDTIPGVLNLVLVREVEQWCFGPHYRVEYPPLRASLPYKGWPIGE